MSFTISSCITFCVLDTNRRKLYRIAKNYLCRHVRLRDNYEMDEDLLPEIFSQQFKRSCLDGPKVGSVAVFPQRRLECPVTDAQSLAG